MKPDLGEEESSPDGGDRSPEDLGGLIRSEAAEIVQLHDSGLRGIERRQLFQGLVERDDVGLSGGDRRVRFLQRYACRGAAPFFPAARASVVHEQSAHRLGGYGEEVSAVLPGDPLLVHELQVRLVDDGRGLQGMAGTFLGEMTFRQSVQLVVHQGDELVESLLVPLVPGQQETGHLAGR